MVDNCMPIAKSPFYSYCWITMNHHESPWITHFFHHFQLCRPQASPWARCASWWQARISPPASSAAFWSWTFRRCCWGPPQWSSWVSSLRCGCWDGLGFGLEDCLMLGLCLMSCVFGFGCKGWYSLGLLQKRRMDFQAPPCLDQWQKSTKMIQSDKFIILCCPHKWQKILKAQVQNRCPESHFRCCFHPRFQEYGDNFWIFLR